MAISHDNGSKDKDCRRWGVTINPEPSDFVRSAPLINRLIIEHSSKSISDDFFIAMEFHRDYPSPK